MTQSHITNKCTNYSLLIHDLSLYLLFWDSSVDFCLFEKTSFYVEDYAAHHHQPLCVSLSVSFPPMSFHSFSPSDHKFATGSDDGTVRIWDFYRCYEEKVLRGKETFSTLFFSCILWFDLWVMVNSTYVMLKYEFNYLWWKKLNKLIKKYYGKEITTFVFAYIYYTEDKLLNKLSSVGVCVCACLSVFKYMWDVKRVRLSTNKLIILQCPSTHSG